MDTVNRLMSEMALVLGQAFGMSTHMVIENFSTAVRQRSLMKLDEFGITLKLLDLQELTNKGLSELQEQLEFEKLVLANGLKLMEDFVDEQKSDGILMIGFPE